MFKHLLILFVVILLMAGCTKIDDTITTETSPVEIPDVIETTGSSFFFDQTITVATYAGKFLFHEQPIEETVSVTIDEIADLSYGKWYEIRLSAVEDVPVERLKLGYFYSDHDKIYRLPSTAENLDAIMASNDVLSDSIIVCQEKDLPDQLSEDEVGWHHSIVIEGDKCAYHTYNNSVETGFYETFVWEKNKGLISYKSGFGADRDVIELLSTQVPLKNDVSDLTEDAIMDNLPESWDRIWESAAQNEGALTDEQIEGINIMLQPYFTDKDQNMIINPISCFFTSNYSDTKDIDLTEFLRYAPIRESMDIEQEFDLLKMHPNWPFAAHLSLKEMPVPIHRYKREAVEALFLQYAGIRLDELSGVGFDEIIYLEATDAYYNYTSDFGPGLFICEDGEVEEGTIRLHGSSHGEVNARFDDHKK